MAFGIVVIDIKSKIGHFAFLDPFFSFSLFFKAIYKVGIMDISFHVLLWDCVPAYEALRLIVFRDGSQISKSINPTTSAAFHWQVEPYPKTTQFSPGLQSYLKNFKTPFFWRYFEFLQLGDSNKSKNDPKTFLKISQ